MVTNVVKIEIDETACAYFVEIDAIELVGKLSATEDNVLGMLVFKKISFLNPEFGRFFGLYQLEREC